MIQYSTYFHLLIDNSFKWNIESLAKIPNNKLYWFQMQQYG